MIFCIQCAMKGMVENKPSWKETGAFDETMEAHMARCHPDPKATQLERIELQKKLAEKFGDKTNE
jgi:hypothetical protein